MDVFEAIRTVLAVRKYQRKPVPPESIRKILEAGRLTASGNNRQPWHFIVIEKPETLQKLSSLISTGKYISQAPAAIAVLIPTGSNFPISDGSRAIQSMILAAWDLGLGSNWVGFLGMEEVRQALGVPNEMDVLAILPIGYPDQPTGQGVKNRKPLAEIASREKYGTPFE